MLEQTKRAKNAMLAAGYTNKEIRVRCPFDRSRGGYGDTQIICRADFDTQIERIDAVIKNGLSVHICVQNDYAKIYYPHYFEESTGGRLMVTNLDCLTAYGRTNFYKSYADWQASIPAPGQVTYPSNYKG